LADFFSHLERLVVLCMLRTRVTYANVMATIAVFIALSGSSYAALKVTSRNVPKDALTGADIKNLRGKDVTNNSLTGADVKNLTSADVADGRLLAEDFAAGQLPRGESGPAGPAGPAGSIQGAPAGGALAGSYPDPTIAAAEAPLDVAENPKSGTDPCALPAPATLVLCGTSANFWFHGGFGFPGVQVWRDRVGQVHIRGSATVSTSLTLTRDLFVLPPAQRPKQPLAFPILTGQDAGAHSPNLALLRVHPEGLVSVSTGGTTDRVVHLGDVAFRTDA
jgi:hypothetical protein